MKRTGALVYRVPFKKLSVFALAGAGAIVFNPKDLHSVDYQARAAFVYGGGADYNLTSRLFVRAEYRGLVYNSPTYQHRGAGRSGSHDAPRRAFHRSWVPILIHVVDDVRAQRCRPLDPVPEAGSGVGLGE